MTIRRAVILALFTIAILGTCYGFWWIRQAMTTSHMIASQVRERLYVGMPYAEVEQHVTEAWRQYHCAHEDWIVDIYLFGFPDERLADNIYLQAHMQERQTVVTGLTRWPIEDYRGGYSGHYSHCEVIDREPLE
jgi:hypothetical protein